MKRLLAWLGSHRPEMFLAAALLLPVLARSGGRVDSFVASGFLPFLPPARVELPESEEGWRELCYRLMRENASLRSRLVAIGEPERLVPLDPAYWERHPRRVEAFVLGRDVSLWRGSVVLSVGSREGVRAGCPAVVGQALVGVVSDVGPLTCRLRLLSDPGSRIWAEILSEGGESGEGCVEGTGAASMTMELVRSGAGRERDPVFTAGGSELVPRGLLAGTVEEIGDVDRNGVAEVSVAPAVPPGRVRVVNVLVPEEPR